MNHVPELFGSMVFNDKVMKARLPKEVYRSLKNTIQRGAPLDPGVADVVAPPKSTTASSTPAATAA